MSRDRGGRGSETAGAPGLHAPGSEAEQPNKVGARRYAGLIGGAVVAAAVIVFIFQNTKEATVHFITARFALPLGQLVLVSVVCGALILGGVLFARRTSQRRRGTERKSR